MLLSVLVHTQSLRFAFPAFIMVGVSPHFFAGWFAWRLLSSVLPRRLYESVDEMAYDSYQSLVTYFFETFTGAKLVFYGDQLPLTKKENVLYISNHQSAVDWVVTDLIAIRQEALGSIRYILKNGLKYLPLYGCYFAQHGCIYVRRGGKQNDLSVQRGLQSFIRNKTPIWLVIFPEGTRYDVEKKHVIKASQEFAAQNGLPQFEHVLTPRTKATELSLKELAPHLDAVYDVTIAYRDPRKPVLPKQKGKSLTEFLAVSGIEVHIHLERIDRKKLPSKEDDIKEWLFNLFEKKERFFGRFLSEASNWPVDEVISTAMYSWFSFIYSIWLFLCYVVPKFDFFQTITVFGKDITNESLLSYFYGEESAGTFPGKGEEIILRTRRTFPYFIFWSGILATTLSTAKGRSLYLKAWSTMGLSSVIYMATLYNWIQA